MQGINHNFNSTLRIEENQPGADLSIKYFFKSNFTKPEIYITLLVIAIIVALFTLPVAFKVAKSISILLAVLTIIFDIGMLATRCFLIPSGIFLWKKLAFNANNFQNQQNAAITLSDGTTLRGSWNRKLENATMDTLVLVFGGNGTIARKSEYAELTNTTPSIEITDLTDLIQMNYRGTNNSEGLFGSHNQHVKDGIEIVAAAKKLGYQKIKIVGHSLGGSIAPAVKAYFDQKEGEDPSTELYAYNTFYRLDEILSCNFKNPIIKVILKLAVKFFLTCAGWDYKYTVEEWDNLKGIKRALGGGRFDSVIRPPIELAEMLQSKGKDGIEVQVSLHGHMNLAPLVRLLK